MGIIKRQSIKGSIYSYLGIGFGFIITGILFPRYLSEEQIGLINLLIAWASLFAIAANLGFNGVTIRLFPYFRTKDKKHHGFVFLMIIVTVIGMILSLIIFYFVKPILIKDSIEQSHLFIEYIYILPILIITTIIFDTFESYNRVLFNASFGTFSRELFQRALILVFLLVYIFKLFNTDFKVFFHFYVFAYSLPGFMILTLLIYQKQFPIYTRISIPKEITRKEIISVSFYGIAIGYSNIIIQRIDTIMINSMIDLTSVGIYSIAVFFGTIVSIPSRSLFKISIVVIADAWKNNDIEKIKSIAKQSSIYQFIFGLLILVLMWGNINNVGRILPESYMVGKYAMLLSAMVNLVTMTFGIHSAILTTSKEYRFQMIFVIALGILTFLTNLLFIPKFGINGAAFASFISSLIINIIRFFYLYNKYKIQPYNYQFIIIFIIALVSYLISLVLPDLNNLFIDLPIRSIIITACFLILSHFTKVLDYRTLLEIKSGGIFKKFK